MHDPFGRALGVLVIVLPVLIMLAMLGVSAWGLSNRNRAAT